MSVPKIAQVRAEVNPTRKEAYRQHYPKDDAFGGNKGLTPAGEYPYAL
ncbi:MAG: hypothetical protein JOY54_09800 [Acidobacteriaceae bacterium]|nr:hypothetical protein [Acidobacteriaceae bacterium]